MVSDELADAERELTQYRRTVEGRDAMVRRTRAAGLTKHRIHILSGIARTTIDRILNRQEK